MVEVPEHIKKYEAYIKPGDFGFKGAEPFYIKAMVELGRGGFIGTVNPLQGQLKRFSFFENTEIGFLRAVQTALYYSRRRRIREELPEQDELLSELEEEGHIIRNEVPGTIPADQRDILMQVFQENKGILIVLNSEAVQRLQLDVEDNFEVATDGGKQFVLSETAVLPFSVVDRIICLGSADFEQLQPFKDQFTLVKVF